MVAIHDQLLLTECFEGICFWSTLNTFSLASCKKRVRPVTSEWLVVCTLGPSCRCLIILDDVWSDRAVEEFMFQGSKATYLVTTRNRGLQQGQAATRLTLSAEVVTSTRNQADLKYFKALAWKADPTVPEKDKLVGHRLTSSPSLCMVCCASSQREKSGFQHCQSF